MFKKNWLKIIVIIFVFALAILLFFLFSSKKKVTETNNNLSLFPNVSIPTYIKGEYEITFDLNNNNLKFPEKLPYLKKQVSKPFTKEEANKIAVNLGFSGDPLEISDVKNGQILVWNSDTNFLTITLKERKIKYGPNFNPTEKIKNTYGNVFSEEEVLAYVKSFLSEKFGSLLINPSLSNYVYLKEQEGLELFKETDAKDAQILQLNFNEGSLKYPLLTLNPQQTNVYVQILKDNTILNMELTPTGNLVESEEKYLIKNYDEIVTNSSKSEIVSINNGNVNLSDINSSDISRVTINDIEIAYFLENQTQEYLQPVFILKGKVKINNILEDLPISLYLSAYK